MTDETGSHVDRGNTHLLTCVDCVMTLGVAEGRLTVWTANRFRNQHDGHNVVETVAP